ncbi:PepSY domain-containing protein [uncultured Roseobacter sp.]|uniref:PepSY domain-containing protein n=1 Tax=uncultured Roseobacter sp. TaxID=114847 RepID=UPI00262CC1F5|nr:PepSY domain-containing protein [uncultured Roseobacter sp.]
MIKNGKMVLLAGLLLPGMALANISVGDALGKSDAAVRAALEAKGYAISEIELDKDEIEVEAMLDGKTYEIEVSPETGLILEIELDDEDGAEDS